MNTEQISKNIFMYTYYRMQSASKRLQSMLQEHYTRIRPESKAVKLKNKFCRKRKTSLQLAQLGTEQYQLAVASFVRSTVCTQFRFNFSIKFNNFDRALMMIVLLTSYVSLILHSTFLILKFLVHVLMLKQNLILLCKLYA